MGFLTKHLEHLWKIFLKSHSESLNYQDFMYYDKLNFDYVSQLKVLIIIIICFNIQIILSDIQFRLSLPWNALLSLRANLIIHLAIIRLWIDFEVFSVFKYSFDQKWKVLLIFLLEIIKCFELFSKAILIKSNNLQLYFFEYESNYQNWTIKYVFV